MCFSTWILGIIVYAPNYFGKNTLKYCLFNKNLKNNINLDPNYSVYDNKTLSCILNRTANKVYTVIFLSILIFIPTFSVLYFYSNIFISIIKNEMNIGKRRIKSTARFKRTVRATKGLFLSCVIFMICHLPFGLVILSDLDDKLPNSAYMYSMLIAHLGSSTNVILYGLTNSQIFKGYKNLFTICLNRKSLSHDPTRFSSATFMNN